MARTVTDAAIALGAMDERTGGADIDYAAGLDARALEGARIGVVPDFSGGNEEVDRIVGAAVERMEELGATIVPVSLAPEMSTLWEDVLGPVGDMEFRSAFESYLGTLKDGEDVPATLEELIAISESPEVRDSDTPVNPARIDGLRAALDASAGEGGAAYQRIVDEDIPAARAEIDSHLDDQRLDALVFPTMSCPASPRHDREDPTYRCEAEDPFLPSYVASVTGYPEVTLPVGADAQGLPVGMSFLGPASGERDLLSLAYALEQAGDYRTLPASTPRL
jgi:amidase